MAVGRLPLLAVCALLLCPAACPAQFGWLWGERAEEDPSGIAWLDDPEQALAESAKSGKPILAYVTSENCGYCRKMERETWSEPAVGRFVERGFTPLKLHADHHREAVAALRVRAFPTTVVISPTGEALAGKAGFLEPLPLIDFLRPSVADRGAGAVAR